MRKIALILAGGSGKRFWPLSEAGKPKQLLSLFSNKTLIEETIERLKKYFKIENIKIITNKELSKKLKGQLKNFPAHNILAEPQPKNTAPSILWAISQIEKQDEETIFGIFPSDHYIADEKKFLQRLDEAFNLADKKEKLITFGIVPTSPETGYGYIETEKPINKNFLKVFSFKEKPGQKKAIKFIKKGNYFWNSGMFVWKERVFRENLRKYSRDFYNFYMRMRNEEDMEQIFYEIESKSIDYALMEKSKETLLVKGDFRWSDVGSFKSLYKLYKKDNKNNAKLGKGLFIESDSCFLFSEKSPIALIGLKNVFAIEKNGKIVVGDLDKSQEVKDAYKFFEKDEENE